MNIQKLNRASLEVLQGKSVILQGSDITRAIQMYFILKKFDIKVIAYYESNGLFRKEFFLLGIPTIRSHLKLCDFIEKHKKVALILQPTTIEAFSDCRLKQEVELLDIELSPLEFGEVSLSFSYLSVINTLENPVLYKLCQLYWYWGRKKKEKPLKLILNKNSQHSPVLLCLPPKTADHSLIYTFDKINCGGKKINFWKLNHNPQKIDKNACINSGKPIKIIVAVREPISQNLSAMYQKLSTGNTLFDWLLGLLNRKKLKERLLILEQYNQIYKSDYIDMQIIWDEFVARYIYTPNNTKLLSYHPVSIQQFIPIFSKCVVDITKYPFDQVNGYTIIKEANIEIFVYQLEKLNNVVPVLSDWLEIPFESLAKGNAATDKWVGESYKQAQKEIKISQEYFDKCFDESYVKHCYSEEDIEKFKEKWRANISERMAIS